jgi:hypothetical protein
VSYYGNLVLARCARRLTSEPAIKHFGSAQLDLRELGDGWQLLSAMVSSSYHQDFPAGSRNWVRDHSDSLLAVSITDMCGTILAIEPDESSIGLHLRDTADDCRAFTPAHPFTPKSVDDATATLAGWALRAGLTPDVDTLRNALAPRADLGEYRFTYELARDVVVGLGFGEIPPPLPRTIDPIVAPYAAITSRIGGLAASAWVVRRYHNDGELPAWVDDAIELDERIWAAVYAADPDTDALQRDIVAVTIAYEQYLAESEPPAATTTVNGQQVYTAEHVTRVMQRMRASGQFIE